ncbi:hypothetical protein EDD32_1501 [Georgenia muralis]|uniref:Uncharacterized protein n=2 Tax=Georgenia muralis TaxID=154117 RepID=A0A3N5A5K7_9MICO|nr:hypothetical protein EDD32_1501 [Georgenia muralis]
MRNRRVAVVIAAVVALVMILPFLLPLVSAAAADQVGGGPAAEQRPAGGDVTVRAAVADVDAPLVVIGTSGLRWEDLGALSTPNLWELAGSGGAATMVVRSVRSSACPADGWLALSAGRRAADLPTDTFGTCRLLREPTSNGQVRGWSDYVEAAGAASYDAEPGLLGDLLTEEDVPAVAVGPGAAVALAGSDGTVAADHTFAPTSADRLGEQVAQALPGHALAVVDVGSVRDRNRPLVDVPEGLAGRNDDPTEEPDPSQTQEPTTSEAWLLTAPERSAQVARVDARVGAVLDAVREQAPDATVVVASLADSGTAPLMQLLATVGPATVTATEGGSLLDTRSTRQPGMVQSTDLTPTVLAALGIDAPPGLAGAPVTAAPDGRAGPERVAHLVDVGRHAVAIRPLVGPFYSALVLGNLLLYGVVTLGLNRRVLDRAADWLDRRRTGDRLAGALRSRRPATALRALRAAAVVVGAVPVASYLANLLPWWRADSPGAVLYGTTAALAVVVAVVALAGPWRRQLLGPVAVVAGLTALVLAVDALTGARLQVSALMGIQPQVGGRFYGFNNSSFSLFAAATILVAMCVAEPLVRTGRRRLAAGAVAVIGATATALDGLPSIGADFGGPPALVPGFLVLALLALGVRLTVRRVLAVLAVTALVAVSFSVVDWLRPPSERSHLGRFVETVLDGGLWSVVARKAGQNLANLFGSTLTFLAIGGIVLVVLLLSRPLRSARRGTGGGPYDWLVGTTPPARIDRAVVMLVPGLTALATTFAIGFAVNDSGIVIPAIGISLAVPLLVSVLAGWLVQASPESAGPRRSAPAPAEPAGPGEPGERVDPAAGPGGATPAEPAEGATPDSRTVETSSGGAQAR